jgi:hypothetical protein
MTRLDGVAKKPRLLEMAKNMRAASSAFVAQPFFQAA